MPPKKKKGKKKGKKKKGKKEFLPLIYNIPDYEVALEFYFIAYAIYIYFKKEKIYLIKLISKN